MIQLPETIVGQIAPSSDAGQSLEVLTQPIISNKSKKQRGKWINHAVRSAHRSHCGFIFSPPLYLFPFFYYSSLAPYCTLSSRAAGS